MNDLIIRKATIEDLKDINFNNIKNITITSAASTPKVITDEVIGALQNIDTTTFKTKIELLDYIKWKSKSE